MSEKVIEALIEDAEFHNLNRDLSETTLFDVLDISFKERTHSRMLGWLLDPSESHGLGDTTLRRFLYLAAKLARDKPVDFDGNGRPITPLQSETYSFRDLAIHEEYCLSPERRLDLLLCSEREGWLCVIENKILSDEGEEQTTDYYGEMLNNFPVAKFPSRLFIYLTPDGSRPQSRHFVPMKYSAVESLLDCGSNSASALGRTAIEQYGRCLRRRIVEREQLQEICVRLYRRHRSAIDTIVRYGNVNQLAAMTAERVLESLRDERQAIIPNRQVEWVENKGRDWIAIRPGHWPKDYRAFYCIMFETYGATEIVKVGIRSDHKQRFNDLFRNVTAEIDSAMLSLIRFESKDLDDLEKVVAEGADALLTRVKESFHLLEEVLRIWDLPIVVTAENSLNIT